MPPSKCEIKINKSKEVFEINQICPNTNGSVLYSCNGNVIMANVVCDSKKQIDGDFLPLSVHYSHKTYANGTIPGGYTKREAKPSDFEIITSRLIDRCLRVVFDNSFNYEVVVTITLLSYTKHSSIVPMALKAASAALFCSNLGINKFLTSQSIGIKDGIVDEIDNIENSSLDMLVVACDGEIITIDLQAKDKNYISHDKFIDILSDSMQDLEKTNKYYKAELSKYKKPTLSILNLQNDSTSKPNNEIIECVRGFKDEILDALKHEQTIDINNALFEVVGKISAKIPHIEPDEIKAYMHSYKKILVREKIISTNIRADGRELDEIREIDIKTNILPNTHGSCLFSRGGTKALVVATIGSKKDARLHESLDGDRVEERFMFHYNFPSYSVGECGANFGVGRRELGHGELAKKALVATVDSDIQNASIRVVSEILASNGSSSMASVCGGSIALRGSNLDNKLIAGIAMGLIRDEQNNKDFILSDITAIEDACGDMDLKIAGDRDGISALHLDIKVSGLSIETIKKAISQSAKDRAKILKIMQEACNDITPKTNIKTNESFFVDQKAFSAIIGKGGSNIKELSSSFNVDISLDKQNNQAIITGECKESIQSAKEAILQIADNATQSNDYADIYKEGDVFEGKIIKITNFGMFVSLPKGGEGLVHISKISQNKIDYIDNYFSEGEMINVVVLSLDDGKIQLQLSTLI